MEPFISCQIKDSNHPALMKLLNKNLHLQAAKAIRGKSSMPAAAIYQLGLYAFCMDYPETSQHLLKRAAKMKYIPAILLMGRYHLIAGGCQVNELKNLGSCEQSHFSQALAYYQQAAESFSTAMDQEIKNHCQLNHLDQIESCKKSPLIQKILASYRPTNQIYKTLTADNLNVFPPKIDITYLTIFTELSFLYWIHYMSIIQDPLLITSYFSIAQTMSFMEAAATKCQHYLTFYSKVDFDKSTKLNYSRFKEECFVIRNYTKHIRHLEQVRHQMLKKTDYVSSLEECAKDSSFVEQTSRIMWNVSRVSRQWIESISSRIHYYLSSDFDSSTYQKTYVDYETQEYEAQKQYCNSTNIISYLNNRMAGLYDHLHKKFNKRYKVHL